MSAIERSIASRILLPVLAVAASAFVGMLVLADHVTRKVQEDYDRFTIAAAAAHVTSILDLAASELTAARLGGNAVVVEAKKNAVRGSILAYWYRAGLDGLVLDEEGHAVASTLSADLAPAVAAARRDGFFVVDSPERPLRCLAETFAPWGWSVVTVAGPAPLARVRPEVAYLLPSLTLGALVLVAGVFLVLWRNLRNPVARMVADVDADREVRPTALAEFDRIGAAVNSAVARLRVRTTELAAELERRREAEQATLDKEARIRLLLESTAEGILGMDAAGTCTFCNPAALRLLGHATEGELLGRNVHAIVHHTRPNGAGYPQEDCPLVRTARSGKAVRILDEVFWREDGTSFPVECWSYPMTEGGVQIGAVVGFIDISERTALEQQLRQSQKLEAIGRLAGGIAHDFNNLLTAIVGHATLARDSAEEGSQVREDLEQVLETAEKATSLTRRILAFSRKQPMSLAPVDVNETILGMGKVLSRLLGEDVEVVYRMAGGALVTMADRGQLEQVLLNLWTNARDAMPGGGRLVVGTQAITCDASGAAALGLDGPGRYALVTVEDSGVGMDERTRQRAFEPFFTTKEQGKGTGLGLAIVYGIVRQHRGHVRVASEPGRGTTFSIHLPLASGVAAHPEPPPQAPVQGGAETVLVAEDNDAVRSLARSVLEGAGYRVLLARDGREAVALHAAHADEIALCLFDVVMPRLGGREALAAVRGRRPACPAILMSGYAPAEPGPAAPEHADVPFLAKPFTPRDLLRRVREVLDRPERASA